MPKTYSPLRYPGGKNAIYKYIKQIVAINNINTYIEPFAGGAAVAVRLLLSNDVKRIIINDYDRSIYAFWYSVLYHTDELIKKIRDTEITINEWYRQKEIQSEKENVDLFELGFSTLFLNRTNRSGIIKGGVIGGKKQDGPEKLNCRFNKEKIIEKIILIAEKRNNIELYNMDAYDFIDSVIKKTKKSFIFFDPPYFNKGPSLYTSFYTKENHIELAKKIQTNLRNRKWIITYDHSEIIKNLYSSLEYIEYFLNYSAQKKTKGVEYMFFSKKLIMVDPDNYLHLK
ncbi:DNA adenine methylase [Fervidibacillus albus]|uniref:site-specific DNA-methyltransferase (adenine-specific) n=1 Tax=Fervidibacillus albus TaxID=2980026 RepID=A0A9E8LV71_9BACI|nr:DNA adenine methylase [Fervidibacillus albus]WAA10300.1 DNA adenine methylase [Fervidibacillus albus]